MTRTTHPPGSRDPASPAACGFAFGYAVTSRRDELAAPQNHSVDQAALCGAGVSPAGWAGGDVNPCVTVGTGKSMIKKKKIGAKTN